MLGTVEIAHKGLDAALVNHFADNRLDAAIVGQGDVDTGIEERQLAKPVLQRGEVELGPGERVGARKEGYFRAGLCPGVTGFRKRAVGDTVGKRHLMNPAGAADGQLQGGRQCVHDGDADAVKTAGDLVRILVELTAGVELGHDDFGR